MDAFDSPEFIHDDTSSSTSTTESTKAVKRTTPRPLTGVSNLNMDAFGSLETIQNDTSSDVGYPGAYQSREKEGFSKSSSENCKEHGSSMAKNFHQIEE